MPLARTPFENGPEFGSLPAKLIGPDDIVPGRVDEGDEVILGITIPDEHHVGVWIVTQLVALPAGGD
jgi:hypothetical protein